MSKIGTFLDIINSFEEGFPGMPSAQNRDLEARKAIWSDIVTPEGFSALLSDLSDSVIEEAAERSHELTVRNFGRVAHLYTPMYLSNYCDNECAYCGFKRDNAIKRRTLTLEEVRREAEFISSKGLRNLLILTGGSRKEAPVSYIRSCVKVLKEFFSSIAIEVYELTLDEYKELIDEGVDGLVIYQEVYDREVYRKVHLAGSKTDYDFRLAAPERALSAGMRTVNIGSLLGLGEWRKEVYLTALHAAYLEKKFPAAEISVSVPRIRPQVSSFIPNSLVTDRDLVQIVTSLRIFLPRVGITLSTRERASLRDMLILAGVTRMSAGSTTVVGGHTLPGEPCRAEQFEILDERGVEEIKKMLRAKGYQPVLKDWA